jgi:hypothetical protein
MPRKLPWRELGSELSTDEADELLSKMKRHSTGKNNAMPCTACGAGSHHGMRYKLLKCESATCSGVTCSWRGKVLVCMDTGDSYIYELGDHFTASSSPKRARLTGTQKDFCRELAQQRLRPLRIQLAMGRKFQLPASDIPPLDKVQNFCNYYSRTELDNHDRLDDLKEWIHSRAYTGSDGEHDMFTFAWDMDEKGKPVVGDGSDEEPFVIGLTTKALVRRLTLPPVRYVLHIDATFKLNTSEYPVIVVGISDCARSFHLVALFIVSQRLQQIYESCLAALSRVYSWITQLRLLPRFVMGDAEQGQMNAVFSVFQNNPGMEYLMCFFHIMTNVEKHMKGFPSHVACAIVRGLYDLHFARDQIAFSCLRDQLLSNWRRDFCTYLEGQWLRGHFSRWQCFTTPSGFATTNNPVEQFNKVLKRDYTLRRRLKMGTLLKELRDCCMHESSRQRSFRMEPEAAPTLTRRVAELLREKLLLRNAEADRITGDNGVMHVSSYPARCIVVEGASRSTEEEIAVSARMGVNYARMEVQGEPPYGWPVKLRQKLCPCNYCFKFDACVHLVYALSATDRMDGAGRRILVSRRIGQKCNGVTCHTSVRCHT